MIVHRPLFSSNQQCLRLCNAMYVSCIYYTERPDPPFNVTGFEYGAHWVALRWTPSFDGNRPVTSFLVFIHSSVVSVNFTVFNPDDLMTSDGSVMYNISSNDRILPYTNYSFTVKSCNEIGCSDQSDPSPTVESSQDGKSKLYKQEYYRKDFTTAAICSLPV